MTGVSYEGDGIYAVKDFGLHLMKSMSRVMPTLDENSASRASPTALSARLPR